MSKIYGHLYDLIGNTPLLRLQGYEATHGISAQIVEMCIRDRCKRMSQFYYWAAAYKQLGICKMFFPWQGSLYEKGLQPWLYWMQKVWEGLPHRSGKSYRELGVYWSKATHQLSCLWRGLSHPLYPFLPLDKMRKRLLKQPLFLWSVFWNKKMDF